MTMKTKRFSLAVILTIYSIPTLLSGLDIYKGTEPDLSSEWIIVSIFFVLSLVFFITNLLELVKRNKLTST
jgi:undecaprenyl pyrophosphate phosphatase UppP